MAKTATFHDLDGASVFITGGGSGIGASLTEGFLEQGAKVAFIGRSDASEFAAEVGERHGNTPLFIQGDITDTAVLRDALAQAKAAHGPVTALVNNAANDKRHTTEEVDDDFYDWMMAINFKAYFFACQAVIPQMRKAGGGSIINSTSIRAMKGTRGADAYTSAKGGVLTLTKALAIECAPMRIRVNAVAPGAVLTERTQAMGMTGDDERDNPARPIRTGRPEEVAQVALMLASDESSLVNGAIIPVDSGASAY